MHIIYLKYSGPRLILLNILTAAYGRCTRIKSQIIFAYIRIVNSKDVMSQNFFRNTYNYKPNSDQHHFFKDSLPFSQAFW